MVSGVVLGALATIATCILVIICGVIGWVGKKVWKLQTSKIPEIEAEINSLDQSVRGVPGDPAEMGYAQETDERLEELNTKLEEVQSLIIELEERRQMEHGEVVESLSQLGEKLEDAEVIDEDPTDDLDSPSGKSPIRDREFDDD